MRKSIIELLESKKNYCLSIREISKKLEIDEEDLLEEINKLEEEGVIFHNKSDKYTLLSNTSLKKGIVKITKRRGAIVVLEDTELVLTFNSSFNVLNNDIILVEPYDNMGKAKFVKLLQRKYKDYIGEVVKEKRNYIIRSIEHEDVYIKYKLPLGTKVLMDGKTNSIKEIIGHKDDTDIKVKSVLAENGFPIKFSTEYEKELESVPSSLDDKLIEEEKRKGRFDLRSTLQVTIDGDDTKDFDDAIGYENNTLTISIAEVPYFIPEDSVMDKETILRGISVYPPGMVNPMTHHKISNGICSLIPYEDRFTISIIYKTDEEGNILSYNIGESIINSQFRMTYEDVNLFLEEKDLLYEYEKYADMLDNLYNIALRIKNKMLQDGFLEFSSSEVKFLFDNSKRVNGIKKRHQGKAEELIEFQMLLYNMTMTDYFIKHNLPFIARNHDKPNDEKVSNWNSLLSQRGYKVNKKGKYTSDDIKKSLSAYRGRPEEIVLDDIAIKSQAKAKYSSYNKGHFALGLKAYATFTSPIRRLADYINMRIFIDSILYGDKYARDKWEDKVEGLAIICTDSEKRADTVERIMDNIKKAEYMKNKIGFKYTGLVSEVGEGYIKVLLPNMVYGIVYISKSSYELSKDKFSLINKSNGERILVGDSINVTVVKVCTDTGEITLNRESYREKDNIYEEKKGKKKVKSR